MTISKKYLPKSLSISDRLKQKESIEQKKDRPKLGSYKSKRSSYVVAFEDKFDTKITDDNFISKNIIRQEGIDQILAKGMGAYYSSGSRPNQTKYSWARARLASVIIGGKARNLRPLLFTTPNK